MRTIEFSKIQGTAVTNPLPQSLPHREKEGKPLHPQEVRRWVPRCYATTLPQSLRGKGWEGGGVAVNYGNITNKILTGLLLCVAIWQPQHVLAASFCATSPEGKIRVDDCKYGSYDECKRVIGSLGDCVINPGEKPASAQVAPYCVVTWATECKYYDYETCNQAAKTQMGFCYLNPDYTNPAK